MVHGLITMRYPLRCCLSCGRDTRTKSGYCTRCLPRDPPPDDPPPDDDDIDVDLDHLLFGDFAADTTTADE